MKIFIVMTRDRAFAAKTWAGAKRILTDENGLMETPVHERWSGVRREWRFRIDGQVSTIREANLED